MISARTIICSLRTSLLRPKQWYRCFGDQPASSQPARAIQSGTINENLISISEEVKQAMFEQKPLVALESTIITHGMPFPQNLETALDVENIIKAQGATPATIAIIKGQLHIGVTKAQLTKLADVQPGNTTVKTSRRDLAYVMAMGLDGGTTVSGTIFAANIVGIPVFVTGGIGGVHRMGQDTFDISADLTELGRSSICVVSSGVKSILDIGRTLEYLETQGVCVATFGETKDFPAFYTRRSGHSSPYHVSSAEQAARLIKASRDIQLDSGILVAVPVPEEFAMDESMINTAIDEALADAVSKGVKGKEVTPFVLAAVAQVTQGRSLETNMALIRNNALVGGQISVHYNKLSKAIQPPSSDSDNGVRRSDNGFGTRKGVNASGVRRFHTYIGIGAGRSHTVGRLGTRYLHIGNSAGAGQWRMNNHINDKTTKVTKFDISPDNRKLHTASQSEILRANEITTFKNTSPVVIGGSNVDRSFRVLEGDIKLNGSTHPVKTSISGGGVGRNMAEALCKLGLRPRFITALAEDEDGRFLRSLLPQEVVCGVTCSDRNTANYTAIFDKEGECRMGLGDMNIHDSITPELIRSYKSMFETAPLVVVDGNVPQNTMDAVLQLSAELGKPVFFEPTDLRKATKPFNNRHGLAFATPNLNELRAMASKLGFQQNTHNNKCSNHIEESLFLAQYVVKYVNNLIITLGHHGVITVRKSNDSFFDIDVNEFSNYKPNNQKDDKVRAKLYPVTVLKDVINVSGAGDCFASGFIFAMLHGVEEDVCMSVAFEAARYALHSQNPVPDSFFSYKNIRWNKSAEYINLF